jgi:hypothetical protein
MGVSLVYLGKNDDDSEMHDMCEAIGSKLTQAHIQVQQANLDDGKNLPAANGVTYNQVWFCGHSRFVEANRSIRKSDARTLGGFAIKDIAEFVKTCVIRGKNKIRLICCESAQQQRYAPPKIGDPPDDVSGVLGHELVQTLTNPRLLDQFNTDLDARVSHLEGLILAMAELWRAGKSDQPQFEISGLWGAGDITDDDVPITSFLQDMGSLEAQAKMDDDNVKELQLKRYAEVFENAHCTKKGLPDFFGYRIVQDLLRTWVPA